MNENQYFDKFYEKALCAKEYKELQCLYKIFEKSVTNPFELKMIKSLMQKDKFIEKIQFSKFCLYVNKLNIKFDMELISEMKTLTKDTAQLNTINKIIKKNEDKIHDTKEYNFYRKKIKRNCPHCDKVCVEYNDIPYIICGYSSNRGFDWKGCSNDWCFLCGKKLCKSWDMDRLYSKTNRFHDERCCKSHSFKTRTNYLTDYCQCDTFYVNRK